tara:strand:+ start:1256 stop:1882 length:627 start_codon:yes stop_codon:yes gene_type:complete
MSDKCIGNKYMHPIDTKLYETLYKSSKYSNIDPNTFTAINIIFSILLIIISILFFTKKILPIIFPIIVIGIFIAHIFLDNLDGCIAKLQDKKSDFGKNLDTTGDVLYWLVLTGILLTVIIYNRQDTITIVTLILFIIIDLIAIIIYSMRFQSFSLAIEYMFQGFQIDKNKIPENVIKPQWYDSLFYLCLLPIPVIIFLLRSVIISEAK